MKRYAVTSSGKNGERHIDQNRERQAAHARQAHVLTTNMEQSSLSDHLASPTVDCPAAFLPDMPWRMER